ncbi:MAG: phosphotransferase enzyme family protein [Marinilabiliales bacterium]|nr:MAG: phosphotransferase enzyme family protein [Marinilabiliales bacterium]
MKNTVKDQLISLFETWSGVKAAEVVKLPPSGSYREYYRISGAGKKAIGAYNADKKENESFIYFTRHFIKQGLKVPEIYATGKDNTIYLLQDLGNTTLFSYLSKVRKTNEFPSELEDIYSKVLEELPKFQILGANDIDYSYGYPRAAFDRQSMLWDLNYFKYYFLKLAKIHFYEHDLEKDYHTFIDFLLAADCNYFLYRDFQTRNIMLMDGEPYFIDYQGGRRGALHYDVASLLYQAKAAIPETTRQKLVKHYISAANKLMPLSEEKFFEHYYGYVLIRMLQAMGAYGFRGFYERKEHFLSSIPFVIDNIKWILENVPLPVKLPALENVLTQIVESKELKKYAPKKHKPNRLNVYVSSFSYKKELPVDDSGNGGGFLFDCRALPNPGRFEEYKDKTGRDSEVIEFLQKEDAVFKFLNNAYAIVDQSVEKYILRDFSNLLVGFGCTGGQHRSVYCAEMMAKHLKEKYNVKITLHHIVQEIKE